MKTFSQALIQRGINPDDAAKRAARARRLAVTRRDQRVIPGVASRTRRLIDWSSVTSVTALAQKEREELDTLPPGTERIRAYVRMYDRLNHLVHATPDFISH